MTALYIIAGFLLVLAALLLVRVKIGVSYIGDLRVYLRAGPLRLDLTPQPSEEAGPPAEPTPEPPHKKKEKKKKKKSYSAREALPVALDTIGKLLRRTRRWLYCGRFVLKVNVACEDPGRDRRALRTHQRAGGRAYPCRARAAPFEAARERLL